MGGRVIGVAPERVCTLANGRFSHLPGQRYGAYHYRHFVDKFPLLFIYLRLLLSL